MYHARQGMRILALVGMMIQVLHEQDFWTGMEVVIRMAGIAGMRMPLDLNMGAMKMGGIAL